MFDKYPSANTLSMNVKTKKASTLVSSLAFDTVPMSANNSHVNQNNNVADAPLVKFLISSDGIERLLNSTPVAFQNIRNRVQSRVGSNRKRQTLSALAWALVLLG